MKSGIYRLGLYIVSSRLFKCSLAYAEKSFYRGAKIGRLASDEIVLQLIKKMYRLPILLCRLEPFDLSTTELRSLDFAINRFFGKFRNSSKLQAWKLLNFARTISVLICLASC